MSPWTSIVFESSRHLHFFFISIQSFGLSVAHARYSCFARMKIYFLCSWIFLLCDALRQNIYIEWNSSTLATYQIGNALNNMTQVETPRIVWPCPIACFLIRIRDKMGDLQSLAILN
ncbi:hypothetical protein BDV40DRAFT_238602 [Aspergillus tamarii]|uniref:Uncharacterized protein n=1 Tax=Aspergillus tamarii TaxID=41984 RepID=A0A5N6V7B9_ASPTM|nr:hypothetical protein BDV40DRAFT_238602 [Aspergillus tamarii]